MTCSGLVCPAEQGKKPLTFQDIMKFRAIADPVISEDGSWVAYTARPDRGDGDVRIQGTKAETSFTIERGSKPVFSKDSCWLAAVINPKAVDLEKAGKEKPRPGLSVLDLATGRLISFDKIEKFSFSPDSSWLACHLFKEEEKKEEKPKEEEKADKEAPRPKMKETGSLFILRHLESEKETRIPHVLSYAFDEQGRYLAYAMAEPEGLKNGVFCLDLKKEGSPALTALAQEKMMYGQLTWEKDGNALAFLAATADEKGNKGGASLWIWTAKTGKSRAADSADSLSSGWVIPSKNKLNWSKDGKRVFFGLQPDEIFKLQSGLEEETQKTEEIDLFDLDRILEKREVDVWHWNDPRIIPHQKKQWPRVKEKTHLAVFHVDSGKMVPLADREVHEVEIPENPRLALGFSDVPYLKEMTWNGIYTDVYHIDLATGRKTKILSRQRFTPTLSPSGNYVLYFREGHWHLYDIGRGASRNLTAALPWPFFDEENDVPGEAPPYGFDGWLEDESGLLLYDRYDIWKVSTRREEALNLTDGKGRKAGLTFRILRLDPEQKFLKKDESLLLSAYHNLTKHSGFYAASVARPGVEKRLEENKKFAFLAMAKNADVILFTRESYAEFPDIWVSGTDFKAPLRLTDVNPQIRDFAWGSA
ncbi:MAG: hypothetical protein FJY81_06180, partial [Candidatus Aminicenantes bacterium]|nr:hypothetical protein [Candidatus Aminicenantes bacterium]